jgi:hypothetical protein
MAGILKSRKADFTAATLQLTDALGAARSKSDPQAMLLAALELGDAHAATKSFAAVR